MGVRHKQEWTKEAGHIQTKTRTHTRTHECTHAIHTHIRARAHTHTHSRAVHKHAHALESTALYKGLADSMYSCVHAFSCAGLWLVRLLR
jgi:hypothetical protein